MPEKKEAPIVIELYELWNQIKARFKIVSPQPRSFTLRKEVTPILSLDGPKLKMIDLSDSTVVAHTGGTNVQTLQPAVGYIYKIRALAYQAVAVGAAGTHNLSITLTDGTNTINLGYVASNFGANILISINTTGAMQFYGDVAARPITGIEQLEWLTKSLMCNNSVYLNFTYENNTGADQSANRPLFVLVEEVIEGP